MARVFDEQQQKEATQERARMAKGEKRCDRCESLFSPEKPDRYICSNCNDYMMKD